MAVLLQTDDERDYERKIEIEDREWAADREEALRRHNLELAKAKLAVPQKHKTITRVALAFAKAPALVVLAIMTPLLVLRGREVPEQLFEFMSL